MQLHPSITSAGRAGAAPTTAERRLPGSSKRVSPADVLLGGGGGAQTSFKSWEGMIQVAGRDLRQRLHRSREPLDSRWRGKHSMFGGTSKILNPRDRPIVLPMGFIQFNPTPMSWSKAGFPIKSYSADSLADHKNAVTGLELRLLWANHEWRCALSSCKDTD